MSVDLAMTALSYLVTHSSLLIKNCEFEYSFFVFFSVQDPSNVGMVNKKKMCKLFW